MNYTFITITVALFFACSVGTAQSPATNVDGQNQKRFPVDSNKINPQTLTSFSVRSLENIGNKYVKLTSSIDKQSLKLLKRMQKREEKLRSKLAIKDSAKSAELFSNSTMSYQQLQDKLKSPVDKAVPNQLKEYIPNLDSLGASISFLQKMPGITPDRLKQLGQANSQLQELQGKIQVANEIKEYVKQRQQQLKEQLAGYGLGKQLLGINKEAYYYGQRLADYKAVINDRKKLEEKLVATIREIPAFKDFWQHNSILSRFFPMPDNFGTVQALEGLQTSGQVNGLIQQRTGISNVTNNGIAAGPAIPQQYIEQAQQQLDQLKDKVSQLGGTGGDMIVPDFQPNPRKTKSLFQSLEYGMDIQTQGSTSLLPMYTEIALTVGYKATNSIHFGVGTAYKIGLGRGWNHLSLSSEGIGLRSYLDIKTTNSSTSTISKLFGDIWVTGGIEYNYMQSFKSLQELHTNIDVWQKSMLAGLTKKYRAGKKEGKIQLLYDFLVNQQIPSAQNFKFRIGWSL